jgi:hypothetical protein
MVPRILTPYRDSVDGIRDRVSYQKLVTRKRYGLVRCAVGISLTSALDGGGWSIPRPGRFTPGKETRYPLYRRLGGPQGRSGRVREISLPPPGLDPRTVQPVASRYTD